MRPRGVDKQQRSPGKQLYGNSTGSCRTYRPPLNCAKLTEKERSGCARNALSSLVQGSLKANGSPSSMADCLRWVNTASRSRCDEGNTCQALFGRLCLYLSWTPRYATGRGRAAGLRRRGIAGVVQLICAVICRRDRGVGQVCGPSTSLGRARGTSDGADLVLRPVLAVGRRREASFASLTNFGSVLDQAHGRSGTSTPRRTCRRTVIRQSDAYAGPAPQEWPARSSPSGTASRSCCNDAGTTWQRVGSCATSGQSPLA